MNQPEVSDCRTASNKITDALAELRPNGRILGWIIIASTITEDGGTGVVTGRNGHIDTYGLLEHAKRRFEDEDCE